MTMPLWRLAPVSDQKCGAPSTRPNSMSALPSAVRLAAFASICPEGIRPPVLTL